MPLHLADDRQAVEEGLIDSMGGISDAIACLNEMIDEEEAKREETAPEDQSEGGDAE